MNVYKAYKKFRSMEIFILGISLTLYVISEGSKLFYTMMYS